MSNAGRIQGILLGIFFLLALFLGSANVRLMNRVRQLEGASEGDRKRPPRTETEALPPPTAPLPSKVPAAPPPPADPEKTDPEAAPKAARKDGSPPLAFTLNGGSFTLTRGRTDEDLGLNDAQRKAIEEIRKNRNIQAQAYKDMIKRIDEQTDQAIRALLTPEQLAKYDAPHGDVQAFVQQNEPKTSSGLKPGYLGISGDDAPGGGARVTDVSPNSAAGQFGLLKDDVILEVNGQPVNGLGALAERIRDAGEGSPAQLKIRRGTHVFYQSAPLGARPK